MKMSSQMVERALSQFEAEAVPENHPTVTQLNRLFGDHTFFIDGEGLNIIEPTDATADGHAAGQVVKVASWQDPQRTSLVAHPPEPTDVMVELDGDGPASLN